MQIKACWTEELSLADSLKVLQEISLGHCNKAGTYGRVLSKFIKRGEWSKVISFDVSKLYDRYGDTKYCDVLYHLRQAQAMFQKLEPLELGVDKTKVAYEKFLESEVACKESNAFFQALYRGSVFPTCADAKIFYRMRTFIREVLGRCPSIRELNLAFGPGATTSIKRCDSNATNKLAEELTCSLELVKSGAFHDIVRSCPHWAQAHEQTCYTELGEECYEMGVYDVRIQQSQIEFVPKNAKTYRLIVKQPTMNGFLQAGIGSFMTRRLLSRGLTLKDQSVNRALAKIGSLTGALATLDLSSASDTISYWLVKFLLPESWFRLLASARCGSAVYKKRSHNLEQFSSMGNSFSFPLESLIFWALAKTCTEAFEGPLQDSRVSCFGDDMIVPTSVSPLVCHMLSMCGFSVNQEKSFVTGCFRESCGADYYLGTDIRPFYQKHLVSGRTLFNLHNYYYRHGQIARAEKVLSFIPTHLRLYGPDGYGDGHLVSNRWSGKLDKKLKQAGYGGVFFETYSCRARSTPSIYPGDWVSPLYSVYTKDREEFLPGISDPGEVRFDKAGRPLWGLPVAIDVQEYKKISVYTFAQPSKMVA